ncbi:HAD-IIIC family phosphatase [Candidatus Pelagibacter sp. Uisw_099_02]|uniref:HAD-IIIC family phosphatase n=1 Tax=Candidatus Pelagibacter sp. Uisw_099_02 TaxID=3230981 RepID=UPI0039EBA244
MIITLVSSSFLFPGNLSWNKIDIKKNFSDIGDYKILHDTKKNDFVVLTLFLQDFHNNNFKEYLPILKLLKSRSKEKRIGTLVMVSSFKKGNLIKVNNNTTNQEKNKKKLLNQFLKIKDNNHNFNYADLDEIFKLKGMENVFDLRNKYLSSSNLSQIGIDILSEFIDDFFVRYTKPRSKVLILDCDNTLWGGVLGEDGINNIKIGDTQSGKIFLDFQKEILKLYNQGVLLAISSKNNEKDVFNVLKNHPSILLKKKHFVNFKINWESKAKNILQISKELDLGLDSFVFWDDNPVERNLVRKILPEVHTVEPNDDIVYWSEQLASLKKFSLLSNLKNSKDKTKNYHARAKFIDDKKTAKDEIQYLKSIKLKAKIHKLDKTNIHRASEMTLKTNQYNLRSKRYPLSEMEKIFKDDNKFCFLISLKDIYSDHGNVGLIILQKNGKKTLFIDTFLMSCRVIGRYFESCMFSYIRKYASKNKYDNVIGEFINTEKNIVAKKLFEEHGFNKIKKRGSNKIDTYLCLTNKIKKINLELYE